MQIKAGRLLPNQTRLLQNVGETRMLKISSLGKLIKA
jgi:hypothetical protein